MAYKTSRIRADDPAITTLYGDRTFETSCTYLSSSLLSLSESKSGKLSILDVGCGPGKITYDIAVLYPKAQVLGVDNSAGIIFQASRTFTPGDSDSDSNPAPPNLKYVVADATDLSQFSDDSFDVVHAHALLVHIPDAVQVLREMRRVCKQGGFVACRESSINVVLSLKPDVQGIREYWERAQESMRTVGGHLDAGLKLREWAIAAGFQEQQVKASKSPQWQGSHRGVTLGEQAEKMVQYGMATRDEMKMWEQAWAEWEEAEGHEFILETGEIVCFK